MTDPQLAAAAFPMVSNHQRNTRPLPQEFSLHRTTGGVGVEHIQGGYLPDFPHMLSQRQDLNHPFFQRDKQWNILMSIVPDIQNIMALAVLFSHRQQNTSKFLVRIMRKPYLPTASSFTAPA